MIWINFYNADLFGAIRIVRRQQCNEKHFYKTCRTWIMHLFGVRSIGVWVVRKIRKKFMLMIPKQPLVAAFISLQAWTSHVFTWGCKSRTC